MSTLCNLLTRSMVSFDRLYFFFWLFSYPLSCVVENPSSKQRPSIDVPLFLMTSDFPRFHCADELTPLPRLWIVGKRSPPRAEFAIQRRPRLSLGSLVAFLRVFKKTVRPHAVRLRSLSLRVESILCPN